MNVTSYRAQIEQDLAWRTAELRFVENTGATITFTPEADQFRRAAVVLLYAHFEGFCKFVFLAYVEALNAEHLSCGRAAYALTAATLSDVFSALRDPTRRNVELPQSLPADGDLQKFARERHLIEKLDDISNRAVEIDDKFIENEGNLKPSALRRILYRLDLPHTEFDGLAPTIDKLLRFRNGIAHGSFKAGVSRRAYDELRDTVLHVMNEIAEIILDAMKRRRYLRGA